jgi:putative ABC transport system permease protein
MVLLKIAARNVLRNKRRSTITFIGIGMGLVMIIIFQGVIGGMDTQITDNFIRAQAGHIQIHAQGYAKKARLFSLDARLGDPDALAEKVRTVPGVNDVAQRIRFGALIGTRRESLRVLGLAIQPDQERRIGTLSDVIVSGSYLNDQTGYALIGKQLADDLGLKDGDVLTIVANTASGALNAIDAEIRGIFYTGYSQLDSATVVLDLTDAQTLLDMKGQVTELAIMLDNIDRTDAVAAKLAMLLADDRIEIETWKETGAAIWQLLQLRRWILGVISIIVIVIAALGIANTMLMSVFERTREIGTLMALGTTPREILALFLAESAIIGAAGGLVGSALGGTVVKVLSIVGIKPPISFSNVVDAPLGTTIYASFSWATLGLFFAMAALVAMLSALYPAFLASRQEPMTALRHV